MSYKLNLFTSGSPVTVSLDDLGNKEYHHPVTGSDLLDEFTIGEIARSTDLSASLQAGEITIEDTWGRSITDIIDAILYIRKPRAYGFLRKPGNTTMTPIAAAFTFYRMSASTIPDTESYEVSHSFHNRLMYTGSESKSFEVVYHASALNATSNGDNVVLGIFKNGDTMLSQSVQSGCVTSLVSDRRCISGNVIANMAPNDYVELHVMNLTDTTDFSLGFMTMGMYENDRNI